MYIQRQAKVLTLGNPDSKRLLVVLHGYGQLADYFIRKFVSLENDFFIVAPEGPHRFYLNGFSGRVGASWMTKEKRDWDITDNMNYLNQVLDKYGIDKEIHILGFSQGGATAARFVAQTQYPIFNFICWASAFPEEITPQNNDNFKKSHLNFVLGDEDPFFTKEDAQLAIEGYQNKGFTTTLFKGKHDIEMNTLHTVLNIPTFGTLSVNTQK